MSIDFNDTELAFRDCSTRELRRRRKLFKRFRSSDLANSFPAKCARLGLKLHMPIGPLIRRFGFGLFYGGETINEAMSAVKRLNKSGVSAILDYSVEALEGDEALEAATTEILKSIAIGSASGVVSFAVFKVTSVAEANALVGEGEPEAAEAGAKRHSARAKLDAGRVRVARICAAAAERSTRVLVDAEHSWYQDAIDELTLEMMRVYNKKQPVVYNTIQMYRVDRRAYLERLCQLAAAEGFLPGVKLVRGAYLDQERERAQRLGQASPIQATKNDTDAAFDDAMRFCVSRLPEIGLVVATHNEASLTLFNECINNRKLNPSDKRIDVAQLLGMRDNASLIMAAHGYNVSKYVPYGPMRLAFPYLTRRAAENSSVQDQMGRELKLIEDELARRKRAGAG